MCVHLSKNIQIFFPLHSTVCDSLLCQVAQLHYSPLLALDTRIIIKEERLSSRHWFAHKFAQSISKLRLKSTSCFYFSIEIFWQKREKAFNFIASRTLKYSLRSTFRFQPLCGRQDSWHLCMLLLFMMLFSLQMCAASDPSIPSDRSYWHTPNYGPVQKGSTAQCQSANWQLCSHRSPIHHRFVQDKD